MLRLDLPIPPSNNHYKRHFCTRSITRGAGRDIHPVSARLTDEAVTFKDVAAKVARYEARAELSTLPMVVRILVYEGSNRSHRADMDNIPKVVFDALDGVVWKNDRQVSEYSVIRMPGEYERPHIVVQIAEIREPSAPSDGYLALGEEDVHGFSVTGSGSFDGRAD